MYNERRFYTYAYLRRDGTPYYIGKGQGKRAFDRKRHRIKVPPKERILFLKTGLTEEEAFKHEIYMIAVFGRKDLGKGILRNLTDGGEGTSGVVRSEETKEKMREGAKRGNQSFKLKIQKAVELTRMSDGEVFVFDCVRDAARALNLQNSSLSNVCLGKKNSTGGYLARYRTPDILDWGEGLFHRVEEVRQNQKRGPKVSTLKTRKAVELTRISDGGVFIFDSLHDAARELNLSTGNLWSVCQGRKGFKSVKGFTARYLSLDPSKP